MKSRNIPKKPAAKRTSPKNLGIITPDFRELVRQAAYLGKKGYTIPKEVLGAEELEFLQTELFLKPFVPGGGYGAPAGDEAAFPVYRENEKKVYLPRFYGIERYGLPAISEIDPGQDIQVPFVKPLRDYQEKIVNIYIDGVTKTPDGCGGGILQVFTGAGKCLGKDTQILMYDGTIKLVQDIKVGEQIMGDDSTPRNVLSLARGRETMYKVQPKKGEGYIVNESHILSLKYNINLSKTKRKNDILDISVSDYLKLPKSYTSITTGGRFLSGYRVPITFEEKPLEIDPYLFGYWLGDGHYDRTSISTQESSVIKYLVDCFKTKHPSLYLRYTGYQYDYRINSIDPNASNKSNILYNFLKKYNLIKNKHIPHHYLCNSRENQMALLAGLIDSDGYYGGKNCYEITQKNEKLLDDIVYLCRSLGFCAHKRKITKKCYNSYTDGVKTPKEGTYFITNIGGIGLDEIPVLCPRKKCGKRIAPQDVLKYSFDLQKLEVDEYYGFEIDGNRRFVLGDFTVTHNTVMALKIAASLGKKTMILVHKEFLMNQWIERIEEYMPSARVGKIQAQVLDIENKDIVIAMIQTMYNRTFPTEVHSQFGLTIIDEVHRIGSEEFSKTLLRCITPYMLGISATVERKDKLTKLLYMFIGKMLYSSERKQDDPVCVRGIEFISNDTAFNETETDFRGKPKYSTMIGKLCEFGPRKDFVVRVLQDLIEEHPEKQIMVLVHNRSLLTYLHDAIVHRGFATTGFYVGGMKPAALKETESRQIVLATYAMAAEALDIKTLSTLVMATPKTDITQSVGRILRMKHENPIIVDIVDSHELFQNQWKQRKRYYKKCNYRIRCTDSKKYSGMSLDWSADKTWLWAFEPKEVSDAVEAATEEKEPVTIFGGKCCINLEDL
jgi:superfamily II DNA or RNA helicase